MSLPIDPPADSTEASTQRQLWQADPHKFGPGKVHVIDADDNKKTCCGQFLEACPGKITTTLSASCKNCLNTEVRRRERDARKEQQEREQAQFTAQREQERRERKIEYHEYLQTQEWRDKSQAVLKRANYVCEGCGKARATQAHHVTYEHIFAEFLWELRAICKPCHDRIHPEK